MKLNWKCCASPADGMPEEWQSGFSLYVLVTVACANGMAFVDKDRYDLQTKSWVKNGGQSDRRVSHWHPMPEPAIVCAT